jgi:putative metallohydrolase (TIGR04338 family)
VDDYIPIKTRDCPACGAAMTRGRDGGLPPAVEIALAERQASAYRSDETERKGYWVCQGSHWGHPVDPDTGEPTRVPYFHYAAIARAKPVKRSTRPRDSQRSKLYKAERAWFDPTARYQPEFETIAECRAFVDSVTKTKFWQDRSRWRFVAITDGRGRRSAAGGGGEIRLPRSMRSRWVILHELAHVIHWEDRPEVAAHGREFAKTYLALVGRFLSVEDARGLRNSMREHRAKFTLRRKVAA